MSLQEHQAVDLYGVLWWRITPGHLLWYMSAHKDIGLGPETSDTLVCCFPLWSATINYKLTIRTVLVSPRLPGYPPPLSLSHTHAHTPITIFVYNF